MQRNKALWFLAGATVLLLLGAVYEGPIRDWAAYIGIVTKTDPVYDIRAYGAVADDSTDDSSYIQSAIDDANSAGGGVVYIPEGTWDVNSTLTPGDNVTVKGIGYGSRLNCPNDVNCFTFQHGDGTIYYPGFEDLRISGDATHTGYAFWVEGTGNQNVIHWHMKNVHVRTQIGGIGVEAGADVTKLHAQGCRFLTSDMYGLWVEGGSGTELNGLHFADTWFDAHTLGALYINNALQYGVFKNCIFESNQSQYAVYLKGGQAKFDSCLFYNNGTSGSYDPGADVYIANGTKSSCTFDNCGFNSPGSSVVSWYSIISVEPDTLVSVTNSSIVMNDPNHIGFITNTTNAINRVRIENNIVTADGNDLFTATAYSSHTIQNNFNESEYTFNVPDCVVRVATTDATYTDSWGGTYIGPYFNFPDANALVTYTAEIIGVSADLSTCMISRIDEYTYTIKETAADTYDYTLVSSNLTDRIPVAGGVTSRFAIINDNSATAAVKHQVRGKAGENMYWTVRIRALGARYPSTF